jgi:hypothetical protein
MPKKMRHSKFRNTGILFELLARQVTADIIAGNDQSEARELLFKYFKENTELGREWRLYNFLLSEKIKGDSQAERFLSVIVEQRKKLSNSKLAKEKFQLIKEIKDLYPIDEFLKANIKNYRTLASIYKLFEDTVSNDLRFDVQEVYQAKTCIVEHIVDKPRKIANTEDEDTIKLYEQQNEEIRLLSYKMLVEGINKKYKQLDDNQKSVLREYINNISNTNSLGSFLITKIDEVKLELGALSAKVKDSDVVKIKINEVVRQLDKVKPNKVVKDNQIMVVLLGYELLKEIKKQVNEKN